MKLTSIPQYKRNAKRFEQILRILFKYQLGDWLKPSIPEILKKKLEGLGGEDLTAVSHAEGIRLGLTELGTTFIKMGQMLSTRADLVGVEIAGELTRLQSNTPPDSPEAVRAIIEAELGADPDEIYARFDDTPIASASIAQAHLAELKDGTQVVVKVQHEGIEEKVINDLEILIALGEFAEKNSEELRLYQPVATLEEFRRNLLAELDFQREEQNLLRFQSNFAGDETVSIPEVYPEFTAKRVLTMEKLDGVSLAKTDRLREEGADLKEIARRGANAYLEMIFRDRVYHADPHPGNILVLPGNVIGLLDFGMIGHLDNRTSEVFEELIHAFLLKDSELLTDCCLMLGHAPPNLDRDKLQSDVEAFMASNLSGSIQDMDTSRMFTGITDLVRRHRIVQNPGVSLLVKVLVMLEGSSRLVDNDFNLSELLEPYYRKMAKRQLEPKNVFRRMQRTWRDWDRLFQDLPRDVSDVIKRFRKGTLDVHLEHRRLDTVVNRVAYGLIAAAVFLGSSTVLSQAIPPTFKGVSILGLAGIGFGLWLIARLLRAIGKSGGL